MKAVSNLKGKDYEDRLKELDLETLEERRKRGDLIQAYRVLSGKADVDPNIWFTLYQPAENTVCTRQAGGHLNVVPQQWNGEVRKNFWSLRIAETWNKLPDSVKLAKTVNELKNSLDNLMEGQRSRRLGGQL